MLVPVVELDHEVEEVGFPEVRGRLLGVLGPADPAPTQNKLGSFPIGNLISRIHIAVFYVSLRDNTHDYESPIVKPWRHR